jgi:hypothetical protein
MLRSLVAAVAAIALWAGCVSTAAAHREGTVGSPGAPGLGDPYFPLDGNGGYDVRHYGLDLRYEPATDRLAGIATIRARATQNLSAFSLDLLGLEVHTVRVNGRRAAYTHDGHELTVTPRETLRRHRRFTVVVVYDGRPQPLVDPVLGLSGFFPTDDGATIAGQPHGAATWFPVNDHPLDKAAYTFRVSVPAGLEAVANGVLRGSATRGDWTTWTWDARDPMASYLATVDIGEYNIHGYREGGRSYWDAVDPDLYTRPAPRSGSRFALSQVADLSYKRLTRAFDVPAGGAQLTFWVQRDTEPGFDFFAVEAHTPGADDWTTLPDANGHTSSDTGLVCPLGAALFFHPFLAHYETDNGDGTCTPTGTSGTWSAASGASDGYEPWSIDLSAYAGGQVELSLSYVSDAFNNFGGVEIDDIAVSTGQGSTSFEDDGDTLDGWTAPGAPDGSEANANDWIAGTSVQTPPSVGEVADQALSRQPEAIAFLSKLFGPYPFATAGGVVDDDPRIQFALETQTRPVYGKAFFQSRTNPLSSSVVVHELAHQWVGDDVALAAWQHIWLNEGFATYIEFLWSEHEGQATAQEIFDAVTSTPADSPFWNLPIADPGPDHLLDIPVYFRGAATLHALRLRIGDDAFFELLRRWAGENAGRSVTTPQFIALAERIVGHDLRSFFDEWLFTPTKPASLPQAPAPLASSPAARAPAAEDVLGPLRRSLETGKR